MLPFAKVYKSNSVNSKRCRARAILHANEAKRPLRELGKTSRRRHKAKAAKLERLTLIHPDEKRALPTSFFEQPGRDVYFLGSDDRPKSIDEGAISLKVEDSMTIVEDVNNGARCVDAYGRLIFVLLPRQVAMNAHNTDENPFVLKELETLMKKRNYDNRRGKAKRPVPDNGKFPYMTVGKYPYRNRKGLGERDLGEFEGLDRLVSLMNSIERASLGYIDTATIRGMKSVMRQSKVQGIEGRKTSGKNCLYPSLAVVRNSFLPHHVDDDFAYSVVSTVVDGSIRKEDPVIKYFVFGEYGVAVALRPGDILIFNALVYHSISSCTTIANSMNVFSLSLYTKTMVVAGNNNDTPLSEEELRLLG